MAHVPREAVEFTRMVVRAFYPPEFIVVTDAVLRYNNYCAHHDLARRLRIQPKELRQILIRMVHARLMRNEKRQQKRINFKDERRPTRTVNTEFWYVPLAEVVDAFSYRVHHITKEAQAHRSNELAARKHTCERCATEYQQLDILSNSMTESNHFICDRMGVRADRRPLPCGGIIREEDNRAQLRETERIIQKLEEELRPLRSRADMCSRMDIPAHPLDGADEETWGEIVPETVGIYGEAVDDEGLNKELSAKLNEDAGNGDAVLGIDRSLTTTEQKDDGVIPERPSWFNDTNRDADDADDDWVNEQGAAQQQVLGSKTGTAASFSVEEDGKTYYERYLQDIGSGGAVGADAKSSSATPDADAPKGAQQHPSDSSGPASKVIDLEADNTPPATSADPGDDGLEDALLSVAGKQVKLSEVSEEMIELMTAEEFNAYHALARGGGGGDDDDDDDDLE